MSLSSRAVFASFFCAAALVAVVAACGGSGGSGFGPAPDDAGGTGPSKTGSDDGAPGGNPDAVPLLGSNDAGPGNAVDAAPAPAVAVVYAHSDDTLYKLDPTTKAVSVVGLFLGCSSVIDIAIDQASNGYVTTSDGFYKVDLSNAVCTPIASGTYPNSLSFVPKGTLDPNVEALVGYVGSEYIRIDPSTGAITHNVGALSGGYSSSGDIVSVTGGGTFLTVNGNGCGDCLLQVDPKTGDLLQNYGDVQHADVYGLAFWGGVAYGFDDAGEVFSIGVVGGTLVTTPIPVPNAPLGLEFWGAGSTTSAPVVGSDDAGIPIVK